MFVICYPMELRSSTPQVQRNSNDGLQKRQQTLSARALKQRLICSDGEHVCFNMFPYEGNAIHPLPEFTPNQMTARIISS